MVFIHPRTLSLTTRRLIGRVDKRPVGCEYKTRAIFSHLSQINIFTSSQRNIFTPLTKKYFHTSHKIEIRPKSRPKVIYSRNKSHRDHIWGMFQL